MKKEGHIQKLIAEGEHQMLDFMFEIINRCKGQRFNFRHQIRRREAYDTDCSTDVLPSGSGIYRQRVEH